MELIRFVLRASRAVGWWILAKINEFFLNTLEGHFFDIIFIDKIQTISPFKSQTNNQMLSFIPTSKKFFESNS
jgi:hypothetical protein